VAVVAPGSRRASLGFRGIARGFGRASLSLVVLGASPGCHDRDVYLVPRSTKASSISDASAGGAPEKEDTGTRQHPPPPPTGMRDADPPPSEAAAVDHYSTCETDRYPERPQPLGIYLIVDQSKSIESEWSTVVSTLEGFIDESQTLLNVDVGIQYFALTPNLSTPSSTWTTAACTAASYVVPDVAIAPPVNHDALFASIAAHGPDAIAQLVAQSPGASLPESPIDIALSGAIQGAQAWATRNADANPRPVVLLVSAGIDNTGSPPVCDQPQLGAIIAAATGVAGIPSVATYVLAIGDKPDMDQIAFAGGTGSAHAVPTDPTHSDILATLEEIRTSALPCEIDVDASALKNRRVNVELAGTNLTRVQSLAVCDPTAQNLEWYVSAGDGGASHIELCPSTCQTVRGMADATLDVVYGCRTQQAQ